MLSLINRASVDAAINDPFIDRRLRDLLDARARQLKDDTEPDIELGDIAHFHAVEPGDDIAAVNAALGFPVDANLVDGCPFGNPDFTPSWEWIEEHSGYYEVAFVLSDDGFGHILLVPNQPGIDGRLLALCTSHLATV